MGWSTYLDGGTSHDHEREMIWFGILKDVTHLFGALVLLETHSTYIIDAHVEVTISHSWLLDRFQAHFHCYVRLLYVYLTIHYICQS